MESSVPFSVIPMATRMVVVYVVSMPSFLRLLLLSVFAPAGTVCMCRIATESSTAESECEGLAFLNGSKYL